MGLLPNAYPQYLPLHFLVMDGRYMPKESHDSQPVIRNKKQIEWKGIQTRNSEIEVGIQRQDVPPHQYCPYVDEEENSHVQPGPVL